MKPIEELPEPESTFSIEDLAGWRHEGCALAVLGHPIGHSISPSIHNAALSEMALSGSQFADWKYFRFEIPAVPVRPAPNAAGLPEKSAVCFLFTSM